MLPPHTGPRLALHVEILSVGILSAEFLNLCRIEIFFNPLDLAVRNRRDDTGGHFDFLTGLIDHAQHMLLEIAALNFFKTRDVVVAALRLTFHPRHQAHILVDRLGDLIEIVPDARVRREYRTGGVGIAGFNGVDKLAGKIECGHVICTR